MAFSGMDEKLMVSIAAGNRRLQPVEYFNPQVGTGLAQAVFDQSKQLRVAHDPTLADLAWLQLKLRLDQQQHMAIRFEQADHSW